MACYYTVMQTLIFLRHAETEKNPGKPASEWSLSPFGKETATSLLATSEFSNVEVIYVSGERKSKDTAEPLSIRLGIPACEHEGLGEVLRGTAFLTDEEFEREKELQLEDLDYPAFGGETGSEALARFISAVETVTRENPDKTILIVSHGTILTLYFAHLLGTTENLITRWKQTHFLACGITVNGKVTTDIASEETISYVKLLAG